MSVRISTLPNGMRVVTHAMPHLETVSLGVWVGAGTRFETISEHGISHLLEHMAFKGTATRTARQIAEEIESVGGDLNAATSPETTAYYARVLKDDVGLALDILADILQRPRFDGIELEREKDVILQELAAALDSADETAHDLVQEAAFPAQALGRRILGTEESVQSFTPGDLERYLKTHYAPSSMILAAAGATDHDTLVKLATGAFGSLPHTASPTPEPARYCGGFRHHEKPFEQNHLVLCFEGPSYLEDDFYAGQVLSSCLGGGMSSRLFQEVREERGLCYSIYSYCWGLSDTGLFGIHAATGPKQMLDLVAVVTSELERIANDAPDIEEINRSRAQIKAGLLMSLESTGSRAEQIARQVMAFERTLEIDELIERVDAVDGDRVQSLAGRLFIAAPGSLAVVGSRLPKAAIEALTGKYAAPSIEAAE